MRKVLILTAFLGTLAALGTGCGGGGSTTSGTAGSTTSGTAGTGGSGGSTTSTGGATTGTTGGAGGTGGTGGATTATTGGTGGTGGSTTTSTSNLLNGCDPATAEDHTADAVTTIAQVGFKYDPPCIKIKAGNSVKFTAAFMSHPLSGGVSEGGILTPDPNSPIKETKTGTEVTFPFPDAGSFGFYCEFHGGGGMAGVVFVE